MTEPGTPPTGSSSEPAAAADPQTVPDTPAPGPGLEAAGTEVPEEDAPVGQESAPEAHKRAAWWHTSFASAVGALAFGALSLTPSLAASIGSRPGSR